MEASDSRLSAIALLDLCAMVPITEAFMAIAPLDDARRCAQDVADEANGYALRLAKAVYPKYTFLPPTAVATRGEIAYALSVQCQASCDLPVTDDVKTPTITPFTAVGFIGAGNFAQQATDQANAYIARMAESGDGTTGFSVDTTTMVAYNGKIAVTVWVVTYP